jgi:hypothetical protein
MVGEPQIGLNDKLKFYGVDPSSATALEKHHRKRCRKKFSRFLLLSHPLFTKPRSGKSFCTEASKTFYQRGLMVEKTFIFLQSVMLSKGNYSHHECRKLSLKVCNEYHNHFMLIKISTLQFIVLVSHLHECFSCKFYRQQKSETIFCVHYKLSSA